MVNETIRRCSKFGTGFDETDELCKKCEDAVECLKASAKEQFDMQNGDKKFDIYTQPQKPPLMATINIQNNKIHIVILIDIEWIKKRLLGEDKDKSR